MSESTYNVFIILVTINQLTVYYHVFTDGINEVRVTARLFVRLVTKEMLYNSITVRLRNVDTETFLSPLYGLFIRGLASIVPTSLDNIFIVNVQQDTDVDEKVSGHHTYSVILIYIKINQKVVGSKSWPIVICYTDIKTRFVYSEFWNFLANSNFFAERKLSLCSLFTSFQKMFHILFFI